MTSPVKIAVTGAAGQIAYSLLFHLARGAGSFGDRPILLRLLEIPQAMKAAEGVVMELQDGAFPRLAGIELFSDARACFDGVHYALLVGAFPRGASMKRGDLIEKNGPIFVEQGQALLQASPDVQCLVIGNPCNTNAFIALKSAPDIPPSRFFAMTALDENRAKFQIAQKSGRLIQDVRALAIWGNHSATMVPDYENATICGEPLTSHITDSTWLSTTFLTTIQERGAQIIQTRGKSSAASAASACIDHLHRLHTPTPSDDVFSAGIYSDGSHYDIVSDIVYSFPLRTSKDSTWKIAPGFTHSPEMRQRLRVTEQELLKERHIVQKFL